MWNPGKVIKSKALSPAPTGALFYRRAFVLLTSTEVGAGGCLHRGGLSQPHFPPIEVWVAPYFP